MKAREDLPGVAVRRARASDKKPLMAFIKKVWGGHDYIPYVWDRWLKDPSGQMFVAVAGGVPIGMNRVKLVEDGSAWFEGARVHQRYRGRGVATALGENSMNYASARGARVFRLASRSRNRPAHRQVARMSFKEKARVSVYERASTTRFGHQALVAKAKAREGDSLYKSLMESSEYKHAGGLICSSFTCMSLTREMFRKRIESGEVVVADGALAIVRKGEEGDEVWKEICFISGKVEPATRLIKDLLGTEPRSKNVIVFLPVGSRLARAVKGLGFRRSTSLIVFEKKVTKG